MLGVTLGSRPWLFPLPMMAERKPLFWRVHRIRPVGGRPFFTEAK